MPVERIHVGCEVTVAAGAEGTVVCALIVKAVAVEVQPLTVVVTL